MLSGTPRVFVGTVVLQVAFLRGPADRTAVGRALREVPGVADCDVDADAGTVSVTAHVPVDRAVVDEVLRRHGCQVRG